MESQVQKQNVELVREGLDDWIAGDREAAMATFTEDVEVYVPAELGNAGTYRGIEAVRRVEPRLGRGLVGVHR